jgi:hypothetical protein
MFFLVGKLGYSGRLSKETMRRDSSMKLKENTASQDQTDSRGFDFIVKGKSQENRQGKN